MLRRPGCTASQVSDQMSCVQCGKVWDVNDPDPPACGRDLPEDTPIKQRKHRLNPGDHFREAAMRALTNLKASLADVNTDAAHRACANRRNATPAAIGAALREVRLEYGLTQGEMAEMTGVTLAQWSAIESRATIGNRGDKR